MTAATATAITLALAAAAGQPEGLRRVAPGYEDWSPVALSQRIEPVDNRAQLFFENVYEGERAGPFGSSERVYVRMHGGLVAVFPQSSYAETALGIEAEIPPGTVFHLGTVAEALGEAPAAGRAERDGQVSLRQDLAAAPGRAEAASPAPPPDADGSPGQSRGDVADEAAPSIFSSEVYRQRRLAALLAEAARAERAGR